MAYTTINKPNTHFDTTLFTGDNASGRTFTGLNFAPAMIWGKSRDTANLNHQIVDIVRGGTKFIFTNTGGVEDTASHGQITSWNSDGTTWSDGTNGTYPRLYYNDNGQLGGAGSRVWWQWKANGAGVSNTAGTISSTVSANTTSGFSIVTYTSPNSSSDQTVGHGLGVAPSFIITKNLDTAFNWDIYHKGLSSTYGLTFTSDAQRGSNVFGSMTSTTFGTKTSYTHNSTNRYVAYCFADVKGFSKFGSYTGNGSTDGTFVYTGFKPAYVMFKNYTNAGDSWIIIDNKRSTYNVANTYLVANSAGTEGTFTFLDILSNGFKIRQTDTSINASGYGYVYAAFAEQPLVGTNNVPATAR